MEGTRWESPWGHLSKMMEETDNIKSLSKRLTVAIILVVYVYNQAGNHNGEVQ